MSETISVVMPAYRAEPYIAGAVRSVLAQTFSNWLLVIVSDDGEDYEAVLAAEGIADRRCRFVSSGGIKSGVSAAKNAGFDAVTTNYVAILDADDRFKPQKLELVAKALAEHAIVSTALDVTDVAGRSLRHVGVGPDRVLTAGRHKWTNISMDSMIAWDRRRVDGRGDPTLPNMTDLDFLMRLYRTSATSFHIGAPLHEYVKQPNSASNAAGFTERMLTAKQMLRDGMAKGDYPMADPGAVAGLDAFLEVSMEAERRYPEALGKSPGLLFEDHLEPLLRASATSAS
ncbi:MAG TPA: glycosyltransferase family A protein [Devosiaceae bacterium]|jgi:glycosyltransferase involved in cell wall biosynthesis|nr:glycosyltransferase family A protein [Devosiaceae bacterium]